MFTVQKPEDVACKLFEGTGEDKENLAPVSFNVCFSLSANGMELLQWNRAETSNFRFVKIYFL